MHEDDFNKQNEGFSLVSLGTLTSSLTLQMALKVPERRGKRSLQQRSTLSQAFVFIHLKDIQKAFQGLGLSNQAADVEFGVN